MKLEGHAEPVMSVDFHPVKMDMLCSCDRSGEIRIWNVDKHACTCVSKVSVYAGKKTLNCFFLLSNVGPSFEYLPMVHLSGEIIQVLV